jgi:hypothetical protein
VIKKRKRKAEGGRRKEEGGKLKKGKPKKRKTGIEGLGTVFILTSVF